MKPFAAVVLTCVSQAALQGGYTPDWSFYGITPSALSSLTSPKSDYDPYAYYGIDKTPDNPYDNNFQTSIAQSNEDSNYDPYAYHGIKKTSSRKTSTPQPSKRESFEERKERLMEQLIKEGKYTPRSGRRHSHDSGESSDSMSEDDRRTRRNARRQKLRRSSYNTVEDEKEEEEKEEEMDDTADKPDEELTADEYFAKYYPTEHAYDGEFYSFPMESTHADEPSHYYYPDHHEADEAADEAAKDYYEDFFDRYYPNGDFDKHNVDDAADTPYTPHTPHTKEDEAMDMASEEMSSAAADMASEEMSSAAADMASEEMSSAEPATHHDEEEGDISFSEEDTTDMASDMMSSATEPHKPYPYPYSHEMKSEPVFATSDEYFAYYYPEEWAYGEMMGSDMMTSGDMSSSDMMSHAAPEPSPYTAGLYYDSNITDDHDAYFAKYYPNGDFDKHLMGSGMMSGDAERLSAGGYFNSDIVNDHDAYFAKYYPNGEFDKHLMGSGMMSGDAQRLSAGKDFDMNIVNNQDAYFGTYYPEFMLSQPMEPEHEPETETPTEDAEPADAEPTDNILFGPATPEPEETPTDTHTHDYEEDISFSEEDTTGNDTTDHDTTDMASDMMSSAAEEMASEEMSSDVMSSEMMSSAAEEHKPHPYHYYDKHGHDMKSEEIFATADEYFAHYYPEEHAYGEMMTSDMMTSGDMMSSEMMSSEMMSSEMMSSEEPSHHDHDHDSSHHHHDYDFSGFVKTAVRTAPTDTEDAEAEEEMSSEMMSSAAAEAETTAEAETKPSHSKTPTHGHYSQPDHHDTDDAGEEEDMSSEMMSSAAASEEEIDAYFAKWYPELVSADYSSLESQVEIDDYFERHYPDLVEEGATSEDASVDFTLPEGFSGEFDAYGDIDDDEAEGTLHKHNGYYHTHDYDTDAKYDQYDAHDPNLHSELHKHKDMREALKTLKADISSSKTELVDSITKADVANMAMLETKLSELEIETAEKIEEANNSIQTLFDDAIAAAKTEVEDAITANTQDVNDRIAALSDDLDAVFKELSAKAIEQNIAIINDEQIEIPAMTVALNLLGPICVEAGKTIDFEAQVTLSGANEKAFLMLLKDGEVVAISGMSDGEAPSSFSLLYRETVAEESEFTYVIDSEGAASIGPFESQTGVKIFADQYPTVTDILPDACAQE